MQGQRAISRRPSHPPGEGFAYLSRSSNSFAHIMFCVRETAAEQ
jgi:hypothetical protein